MKAGLVLIVMVVLASAVSQGRVGAQSVEVLTTGVVVNVAAASSGQLESFSISDSQGRVVRFTVQVGAPPRPAPEPGRTSSGRQPGSQDRTQSGMHQPEP